MVVQLPTQTGRGGFITRQYAQRYLPERTTADWQRSDEDFAQRGYVLCSMGDERFVNPNFLRVMPDGAIAALCPDRQGRHRMTIGPTAYQAFLSAYNSARPVFERGEEVNLDAVEKVLDSAPEVLTVTLRHAIDTGLRQIRSDRAAEAAALHDHATAEEVVLDQPAEPDEPTPIGSRKSKK